MDQYNPKAIRRCVRVDEVLADGVVTWKTYSMTRPGKDIEHRPAIDFVTGAVTCTCPDHQYRRAKHNPTIHTPDLCCKHARAAIENLRRKAL
jgi:hypothetical protein